jgi:hypothetical protein
MDARMLSKLPLAASGLLITENPTLPVHSLGRRRRQGAFVL